MQLSASAGRDLLSGEDRSASHRNLRLSPGILGIDFDQKPPTAIAASTLREDRRTSFDTPIAFICVVNVLGIFVASQHRLVFGKKAFLIVLFADGTPAATAD